jgi:hypothetical protein
MLRFIFLLGLVGWFGQVNAGVVLKRKPRVFVLAIGFEGRPNWKPEAELNLFGYTYCPTCKTDAGLLASYFGKFNDVKNSEIDSVITRVIDGPVPQDSLFAEFAALRSAMRTDDIFIFYYASGFWGLKANAASGQQESYYLLSAEFSGEQNVAQYSFTLKTLKQLTDQLPCKDQLIVFDTGVGEVIRRDFNTNFFSSDPVTASATRKNRLVLCAEKSGVESKDTADGKVKGDIVRIITSMPAGNNITQLFTGKDATGDLRYKAAMTALWNAQRCCYATVQLLSENDYLQTLLHIRSNFGNAKRSTMTRPAATEKAATPSAAALMGKRRKHAIIIASNQYQAGDLWRELVTPGNDAKEVAGILKQQYGYDTTLLWNPGKKDILRVIDEIVYNEETNPYSQYIIYFAGHGYWAPNRKLGYIVPTDALSLTDPLKPASQELDTYLDYATLFGMLNQLNKVLLITDVCFGGTSFNSLLGRQNEVNPDKDENNKPVNPYRMILASGITEVDDFVRLHDGSVSKHSPFASGLIEVLKSAKGKLSVETLFAQLKDRELNPTPVSRLFGSITEPNEFRL